MLSQMHKYVKKASPRSIPHWRQHLDNLKIYQRTIVERFQKAPGNESGAVKLLRHILNFTNYDELKKYSDDFQRYRRYFVHIREDVKNIFDPVNTGLGYNNLFVSKEHMYPTVEYLLPVDDIDHIKILPFDEPWESWKNLKPVTLWHHDSPELCQNLLKDQIQFRYITPLHATLFIDVTTLSFMYFKFIEHQPDHMTQWASREFIHKYVVGNLFEDILEVWLTQQISAIAECNTRSDLDVLLRNNISSMETRYGYVGGRYSEASLELFNELQLIKNGNVTLSSLYSSKLYPTKSVLERIDYMNAWLSVPDLRQYKYFKLLRDLPYLKLTLNMFKHVPTVTNMQSFIRDFRIDCRKHVIGRTWSSIRNPTVRSYVETEFNELFDTAMSFDV